MHGIPNFCTHLIEKRMDGVIHQTEGERVADLLGLGLVYFDLHRLLTEPDPGIRIRDLILIPDPGIRDLITGDCVDSKIFLISEQCFLKGLARKNSFV